MFKLEQQIRLWRTELLQSGIKNSEVLDELESHLREETQRLTESGISEAEAFNTARQQLGESETLNKEFAKLNRHWLWVYRDNPWQIKLFAVWFVFHGLNGITSLAQMYSIGLNRFNIVPYLIVTLSLLQIPLGIGLLRRHNLWRGYAFVWTGIVFAAWVRFIIFMVQNGITTSNTAPANFIGMSIPVEAMRVIGLISTLMLLWTSYFLARPSVRNLYRRVKAS